MPRQHQQPHLPQPSSIPRPIRPRSQDRRRQHCRRGTPPNPHSHPIWQRWRMVEAHHMARCRPNHMAQSLDRSLHSRNRMPHQRNSTNKRGSSRQSSRSSTHNNLPLLQRGQLTSPLKGEMSTDYVPLFFPEILETRKPDYSRTSSRDSVNGSVSNHQNQPAENRISNPPHHLPIPLLDNRLRIRTHRTSNTDRCDAIERSTPDS